MAAIYLYTNAVLYAALGLWVTLSPGKTADAVGYTQLSNGGHTEYLVVYGGLQIGLAAFFAWTAHSPALQRAGLVFALLLYVPIVLYRSITLAKYWPVGNTTMATAILEIILLIWVLVILLKSRAT